MTSPSGTKKALLFFAIVSHFIVGNQLAHACDIAGTSDLTAATAINDPLYKILKQTPTCPKNVMALRERLKQEGATFSTSMVANRGFHNPSAGSFSFFETVQISNPVHLSNAVSKDELFFGHFTAPSGNALMLDQNENTPSLMVEAIAWDKDKEVYNFYELIGSPQGSRWFYRGDSKNIWSDVSKLHRKRTASEPIFGSSLRCSGCHISGGPIMKEISEPHDSWWRNERPLPFAKRIPDAKMKQVMQTLQDPEGLRDTVVVGLSRLMEGKAFKEKISSSPQIALRPLFCPEEVNLQSTPRPLESQADEVNAPLEFFVDERFLNGATATRASKSDYEEALITLGSKFPEIDSLDGDHAWLAPVKATSDKMAVSKLVASGIIDKKFVLDILAVDMTRPVFSKKRCELLQLVPNTWSANWKAIFQKSLAASSLQSAKKLLQNMSADESAIQSDAMRYLNNCSNQLQQRPGVLALVKYLDQSRKEIFFSEISQNPRGQILEPGFRVIFPKFKNSQEVPWKTTLSEMCLPE